LTVTDNVSQTDTDSRLLRVNAPPAASFVATPPQTVLDAPVTFDASTSSDPDGTIASFAWDFGDGGTATGMVVVHAFTAKLPFTVTLTVTDNDGSTDQTSRAVLVANRRPVITAANPASASVRISQDDGVVITVTAEDPDLDPLSYEWRIDGVLVVGGNAPQLVIPPHGAAGTYTINVTVSDGELQDWREWTLTVDPSPRSASLLPWILGIVLAAVLALVLFVVWRRRKRKPAP
jgi:PKD repeat protein